MPQRTGSLRRTAASGTTATCLPTSASGGVHLQGTHPGDTVSDTLLLPGHESPCALVDKLSSTFAALQTTTLVQVRIAHISRVSFLCCPLCTWRRRPQTSTAAPVKFGNR